MKSLRNLFFVVALIAMPAFSQELTSDITGVVTNSAGAPVSGANVSVTYTLQQIQPLLEPQVPMVDLMLVV